MINKLPVILLAAACLAGCRSTKVISETDDDFQTVTVIFAEENPRGAAPITDSTGSVIGSFRRVVVNEYQETYKEDRAMEVYDAAHTFMYFIGLESVDGVLGFVIRDKKKEVRGRLVVKSDNQGTYMEVSLFDNNPAYAFGIDKNQTKYLAADDELVYVKWEKNTEKDLTMLEYQRRSSFRKSYYQKYPDHALIFAAVFYLLADITYNKSFIYSM
jgi:hypothetical protein